MMAAVVTIVERLAADGLKLFRLRSAVPLLLLPVAVLALPESQRVEIALGSGNAVALQWIALSIALAGALLRCATVAFAPDGTSSRDTHALRAPILNTTGPYSLVRHPLYLGSFLMWLGVAMAIRVWWLVLIVSLSYWLVRRALDCCGGKVPDRAVRSAVCPVGRGDTGLSPATLRVAIVRRTVSVDARSQRAQWRVGCGRGRVDVPVAWRHVALRRASVGKLTLRSKLAARGHHSTVGGKHYYPARIVVAPPSSADRERRATPFKAALTGRQGRPFHPVFRDP